VTIDRDGTRSDQGAAGEDELDAADEGVAIGAGVQADVTGLHAGGCGPPLHAARTKRIVTRTTTPTAAMERMDRIERMDRTDRMDRRVAFRRAEGKTCRRRAD